MKYSIITPVWNRQDCILRCLESVTAQLSDSFEVEHIVVDDGSTDRTLSIMNEYADLHSHVQVISFQNNRGANAARNAAITASTGDYIIPLDSDDWFRPNGLEMIHRVMLDHPDESIYMFSYQEMQDLYDKAGLHDGDYIYYKDRLAGKYKADFNHVIRRSIMQSHPFREDLRIYEIIFYLQFYREADKMFFSSQYALQLERDRSDSVSQEMLRFSEERIQRALAAAQLQIEWFGDDYRKYGLKEIIDDLYWQIFDNSLLLCDYEAASRAFTHINHFRDNRILTARLFYHLHAGTLYRWLIYSYLWFKYKFLKTKLT